MVNFHLSGTPLLFIMKKFEDYFNEVNIIKLICKIRVKIADSRSKSHSLHLLTSNKKYNYHKRFHVKPTNHDGLPQKDDYTIQSEREQLNCFRVYQDRLVAHLACILPPRKKWIKLGRKYRRRMTLNNNSQTSVEKNLKSLLLTIKVEKRKRNKAEWYVNLNAFVEEIMSIFNGSEYQIAKPLIYPKPKDEIKNKRKSKNVPSDQSDNFRNQCRPISIFSLKDRIILSLTNRFLTEVLDDEFEDCSYAFRLKKNVYGKTITHHDCIANILSYRKNNIEKKVFVAECDIQKFYDTVDHKLVMAFFKSLIEKAKIKNPNLNFDVPIKLFESYLNCFAFNVDVIPLGNNEDYWNSYNVTNGCFEWIDDQLINCYYKSVNNERIGVPQGGALSGLIANIYLHEVDVQLNELDIEYYRFCDDMIVFSENFETCKEAIEKYEAELKKIRLYPHKLRTAENMNEEKNIKKRLQNFWKGKSKGPYEWGCVQNDAFPWIGFVGYEIDYLGNTRVRKKSLIKEMNKQKMVINRIKKAVETGMRKPKRSVAESAINRLIGMSVGRIRLDNFDKVHTKMCWANGFRELTDNKYSIRQMKQLDRNRNKLYFDFVKYIKGKETEIKQKGSNRERIDIKYNKPFSYYYQVIERKRNKNT